jgi:hypothetical protein
MVSSGLRVRLCMYLQKAIVSLDNECLSITLNGLIIVLKAIYIITAREGRSWRMWTPHFFSLNANQYIQLSLKDKFDFSDFANSD